jgi:hypothetical protein
MMRSFLGEEKSGTNTGLTAQVRNFFEDRLDERLLDFRFRIQILEFLLLDKKSNARYYRQLLIVRQGAHRPHG